MIRNHNVQLYPSKDNDCSLRNMAIPLSRNVQNPLETTVLQSPCKEQLSEALVENLKSPLIWRGFEKPIYL